MKEFDVKRRTDQMRNSFTINPIVSFVDFLFFFLYF